MNLKITTETGLRITDYLDVTLNLTENTYKPYRKDDQLPVYIHKESNHPPMIKKNLPTMIERRISDRCSNKELFDKHKEDYEQALKKSGYHDKLQYQDSTEQKKKPRRRYPKIFWFKPPPPTT